MFDNFKKKIAIPEFKTGCQLDQENKKQEAIHSYQDAIKTYPSFEDAYLHLAEDLFDLQHYHEEANVLMDLININPNDDYYNRLGVAYYCEGKYQQSISSYSTAINMNNTHEFYYTNLGRAYLKVNNPSKAIWSFQQALHLKPNDDAVYNFLGLAYEANRQFDNARQSYIKASQLVSTNATYHYNIAGVDYQLKNYKEAIPELKEVITLSKNPSARDYNFLGICYSYIRDYRHAIQYYKDSLQLDNSKAYCYANIGLSYGSLGQYNESNQYFRKALQLNPNNKNYYKWIAENEQRTNHSSSAIKAYQQSFLHDQNPVQRAQDLDNIGHIYFNNNDYSKALQYYQKANQLGTTLQYLNDLASVNDRLGKYKQSIQYTKQSIKLAQVNKTNDDFAYLIQMDAYYDSHNYSAQRKDIAFLTKKYPEDSRLPNEMGWSYLADSQPQKAITYFKKAIQMKPMASYYVNLAKAQHQLGNYSQAIQASKQALSIDPKSELGHQELASLKGAKDDLRTSQTFNGLVGLTDVKKQLRKYISRFVVNKARTGQSDHGEIHLVFEGNPGTGKTTVAKLFSKLLFHRGITQKQNYKEINATHLESTLQGGSAKRVNKAIKDAMGGVLFIDEAYSLGRKESSMESALDTLLTGIEKYKDQIVVIMAGYTNKMENFINNANPGLKSRFPDVIHFPNYTSDECWQILKNFLKKKHFKIDSAQKTPQIFAKKFKNYIQEQKKQDPKHFANARTVRNVFEDLDGNFSDRVAQQYRGRLKELGQNGKLNTIRLSDVEHTFNHHIDKNLIKHDYLKDLDSLIGLNTVKTQIRSYINQVKGEKRLYGKDTHGEIHLVFEGNPGTGKTTVAKLFGKILYQYGVTNNDNYVELNATSLSSKWQGESAMKAKNAIQQAMGGVLFIDEAYALGNKESSVQQAVETLLTGIENHQNDIVVILAGYTDKMENLLNNVNPGLRSRFSKVIQFPDYTNAECQQIFALDMKKAKLQISQQNNTRQTLHNDLDKYISVEKGKNQKNFGNARVVRNIFGDVKGNTLNRVAQIPKAQFDKLKAEGKSRMITLPDIKQAFKDYTTQNSVNKHDYMNDLNNLIGLKPIKQQVKAYINQIKANQRIYGKRQNGHGRIHLVFEGNPGTGKTTVAKLLCKILFQKGVTQSDNYTYLNATHLTSSLQGGSVKKVESAVRKAIGGVLFIDEAYSLGKKESSMEEAVDTLLTAVEDHQSDLVVILAGYTKRMENMINYTNPGFKSRFPTVIKFPDYTPQECQQIMQLYIHKSGLSIDKEATQQLLNTDVAKFVKIKKTTEQGNFANARTVRNAFDVLNSAFKSRIAEIPDDQVPTLRKTGQIKQITIADVKHAFTTFGISSNNQPQARNGNGAMNKLDNMVGLSSVKNKLQSYINTHKIKRLMHDSSHDGIHLVFEGGPGTGKTTVARLFAKALYDNHIVQSPRVKEVESQDLMSGYEGQTKDKVKKIINSALGGVLFVDEAYGLEQKPGQPDSFKEDAVTEFIAEVENHRNDLAVILAGYTNKMERFLHHSNAGFSSRFQDRIIFPNYSNQDCFKILMQMLKHKHAHLASDEVKQDLVQHMNSTVTRAKQTEKEDFGNARFVRHVAKQILQTKDNRLGSLPYKQLFSISRYEPNKMKTVQASDVDKAFQSLSY